MSQQEKQAVSIARVRNYLAIKGLAGEIAEKAQSVIAADRDMVVATAEKLLPYVMEELRSLLFEHGRLTQILMQPDEPAPPPEPEASPQELAEEEIEGLVEPPEPKKKLSRRERKRLKAESQKGNGVQKAAP